MLSTSHFSPWFRTAGPHVVGCDCIVRPAGGLVGCGRGPADGGTLRPTCERKWTLEKRWSRCRRSPEGWSAFRVPLSA